VTGFVFYLLYLTGIKNGLIPFASLKGGNETTVNITAYGYLGRHEKSFLKKEGTPEARKKATICLLGHNICLHKQR
jgi:hypothetical protein